MTRFLVITATLFILAAVGLGALWYVANSIDPAVHVVEKSAPYDRPPQ